VVRLSCPATSAPAFSSSALCVSAFGPLPSSCSGGSSDPCSSPIPDSFDATIPFGITSFADPHHLTSIESHLCKKQGRGWSPCQRLHSAQSLPIFPTASKHAAHRNIRNSTPFMRLLHTSLDTRGWGMPPCTLSHFFALRAPGVFHNSFLFIHLRTLLENRRVYPALPLQTPALTPPLASYDSHQSRITSHRFHNFYPTAPKLRHNPAAQGHHPQSDLHTGRIQ
jgi:hypothetical protein